MREERERERDEFGFIEREGISGFILAFVGQSTDFILLINFNV